MRHIWAERIPASTAAKSSLLSIVLTEEELFSESKSGVLPDAKIKNLFLLWMQYLLFETRFLDMAPL